MRQLLRFIDSVDTPGDNILTEANFKEIHRIERAVLRRPDYGQCESYSVGIRCFAAKIDWMGNVILSRHADQPPWL